MGLGQLEREGHQAGGLIQLALFAPVGQLGGRAETVRRAGLLELAGQFQGLVLCRSNLFIAISCEGAPSYTQAA